MFSKVQTCHLDGLTGSLVDVEAENLNGFSAFHIVGLAGTSIQESKERIRAALSSLSLSMPLGRIVVNLLPGEQHKSGAYWDLPILVALLGCMGLVSPMRLNDTAFWGALSLNGEIRGVRGSLAMANALLQAGIHRFVLPAENVTECRLLEGVELIPVHDVQELFRFLRGAESIKIVYGNGQQDGVKRKPSFTGDYADICGQATLKRILEIAAAGKHSLLLIGPPGVGKTMAIRRLPGILPPLTKQERQEATQIASACGLLQGEQIVSDPPFRMPHYTVTKTGLIGGGRPLQPGEITLAHHGVLFLDELLEFPRSLLELLRTPMENGTVLLSKGGRFDEFPCAFQLIACANPCPCGNAGNALKHCSCTETEIRRYRSKLSHPFVDRIDLFWELNGLREGEGKEAENRPETPDMLSRVMEARERQEHRMNKWGVFYNARIPDHVPADALALSAGAEKAIAYLRQHGNLFERGVRKTLLVARTIADLDGAAQIGEKQVFEAFQYRRTQEKYWPTQ
ncbi:MAG: YifB family Mg chelatase-like AAA ATPase [Ndongobacter sp.]|nr:YifB family Mg chelatase-like AAA ATPase [Ndongobacter sp.]